MLTEMQKANINNLDTETCLEIMHECAERLGVVSVDEYQAIVGKPRRTMSTEQSKTSETAVYETRTYSGVRGSPSQVMLTGQSTRLAFRTLLLIINL